jgi:hypothetical protein
MISPSDASSPDEQEDFLRVTQIIAAQSEQARMRIAATAQILRDLLYRDPTDESLLAFTLVMTELSLD